MSGDVIGQVEESEKEGAAEQENPTVCSKRIVKGLARLSEELDLPFDWSDRDG
jgi:hypothetical protein